MSAKEHNEYRRIMTRYWSNANDSQFCYLYKTKRKAQRVERLTNCTVPLLLFRLFLAAALSKNFEARLVLSSLLRHSQIASLW